MGVSEKTFFSCSPSKGSGRQRCLHQKTPSSQRSDLDGNARWSLSEPRGGGHSQNLKFPNLQAMMGAPLSESAVTEGSPFWVNPGLPPR